MAYTHPYGTTQGFTRSNAGGVNEIMMVTTILSGRRRAKLSVQLFDSFGDPVKLIDGEQSHETRELLINEENSDPNNTFASFASWLSEYLYRERDIHGWAVVTLVVFDDTDLFSEAPLVKVKWLVDEGNVELMDSIDIF